MKKRLGLVGILLISLLVLGVVILDKSRMAQFIAESDENFYISLKLDDRRQEVLPWYDEYDDLYYFFLPSCVSDNVIFFDSKPGCRIAWNGREMSLRDSLVWKKGEIYYLELGANSFQVTFMKSENLPSLFIDTESGSMEDVWKDKRHREQGTLIVANENGNIQYHGKLDKISGRGNSTWSFSDKKPYSISLTGRYPLCDLSANKNWNLLNLCYEHGKVSTKIILDIARDIGIAGTPECTWVDLYCEGEYQGLYLLTEDITADYKDVSGILLEREDFDCLEESETYFTTAACQYIFTFKEPSIPSEEQIRETVDYVQNIENLIMAGDDSYKEYIDTDSIAKQYLLDKIFMEEDAMAKSTFYYIDFDADKIYAGPFWDYDRSLGLMYANYAAPIDADPNYMSAWYDTFYADSEFRKTMYTVYTELQPYFERILREDIDRYAEYIHASVEMDNILMKDFINSDTGCYLNWDSYIKFNKYFLANRLNYLNDLWDVKTSDFKTPESTGEYHDVYFEMLDGTVVDKISVLDGTCIKELPPLDKDLYTGWRYWHLYHEYTTLRPVYEDLVLYANPIIEYDSTE